MSIPTKHKIELLLNIDNKLHRQIGKLAAKHNISFNAVLEVLVSKGIYKHLLDNALFAAPISFKNCDNYIEELILLYENRAKTPDPYIVEVELSTDIELYGHNIYQLVEKLVSDYSTSFNTMLAVLIDFNLDRLVKYQINWVLPQDFQHVRQKQQLELSQMNGEQS